jgi:type IV secretion system protein VirD4
VSGPDAYGGLYLGAADDRGLFAGPEHAALILGPPRSGKSACLVVPNILVAPGAVVATSTKLDVARAAGPARSRYGTVWVFDPLGTTAGQFPHAKACRWSPVPGCDNWDTAVMTAHALVQAAQPARGVSDANHWSERAEALLAPLLHAAALVEAGIGWVQRWINRRDLTDALGICASYAEEQAGDVLQGIAGTEERERAAIFSTASGVLGAYRSKAAVTQADRPNFDADTFVDSYDSLFICAPAASQAQTAPLVVALLERIRQAAYRRRPGGRPVTWILDEAANVAPIPNLPAIVSEAGGQGLIVMCCLQDLSQARVRWNRAADGFLTLFAAKLVLPGIADLNTLEHISKLAGTYDHQLTSTSRARGLIFPGRVQSITTSSQQRPRLPVDKVSRQPAGAALAIIGPTAPQVVRLTPWWHPPWGQLAYSSMPSS